MDRFGPTGKVSKKAVHLSRWTTFFGWNGPIEMDCSIWPFRPILYPSTSLFGMFHIQLGGKHLSLQLSWIVNSGSIGVTRTSMCSCNSSVADSRAKCMFWLLTALKTTYFPREFEMFLSSFESGLWIHTANTKIVRHTGWIITHETAHTISLISPSKLSSSSNTSNSDLTSSILNEYEIRFASEMERERSNLLWPIRQQ